MLDFSLVREGKITIPQLANGLTRDDLSRLTDEMVDTMIGLIETCRDEDVTFVPDDPEAYDDAAETEAEIDLAWTLGHVIVHTTASAEESAALASELARGVVHRGGRSRSEVAWETVTTLEQCLRRLEESRRMRQASLAMWPDEPYLNNNYPSYRGDIDVNCIIQFIFGLMHDDSHLEQIAKIVKQARQARNAEI